MFLPKNSFNTILPEVPVAEDEVVEETAAGVDVGGVLARRRVDDDGHEVEEKDGKD